MCFRNTPRSLALKKMITRPRKNLPFLIPPDEFKGSFACHSLEFLQGQDISRGNKFQGSALTYLFFFPKTEN
jgi:hypothetical protein